MDNANAVIKNNDDVNYEKKEELLSTISDMLETLPISELIRIFSYLSALYFC